MALWGTKKDSVGGGAGGSGEKETTARPGARVGIDHALQLMRSLPTDKNPALVVAVLRTTLESLGIRVADIVADAEGRERELEKRVSQLKAEIADLEKGMSQRAEEIVKVEAAHAETTRVRDYLETDEVDLASQAL